MIPIIDIATAGKRISFELPCTLSRAGGTTALQLIPTALVRSRASERLVRLRLQPPALRIAERTLAPTARFALSMKQRKPASVALLVEIKGGARALAAGERVVDVELSFLARFAGRGKVASEPLPAKASVQTDRDIDPGMASSLQSGDDGDDDCHDHWKWTDFPWGERWTQCHGGCPGTRECRCKAKPGNKGFKICFGWVRCTCV